MYRWDEIARWLRDTGLVDLALDDDGVEAIRALNALLAREHAHLWASTRHAVVQLAD